MLLVVLVVSILLLLPSVHFLLFSCWSLPHFYYFMLPASASSKLHCSLRSGLLLLPWRFSCSLFFLPCLLLVILFFFFPDSFPFSCHFNLSAKEINPINSRGDEISERLDRGEREGGGRGGEKRGSEFQWAEGSPSPLRSGLPGVLRSREHSSPISPVLRPREHSRPISCELGAYLWRDDVRLRVAHARYDNGLKFNFISLKH